MTDTLALSLLQIGGMDAEKFLQSQLTLDISTVTADQGHLAAYCNQKGFVEVLFWLTRTADGFCALMATDLIDNMLVLCKKYGAFSKIRLTTTSLADAALNFKAQVPALAWQDHQLNLALPCPALMLKQAAAFDQWRAYWLARGVATLSHATCGLFRPHELNLPELGAVSFNKGCYPGQEIVARMHYRGKAKAHLQRLILNAPTTAGTVLYEQEQVIATVVDTLTMANGHFALTAVINDHFYQQLPITCQLGQLSAWLNDD